MQVASVRDGRHSEEVRALLGVDLDGTLVRKDGTIAESDLDACAVARNHGIGVLVVTGRLPADCWNVAPCSSAELPLICADGAVITQVARRCHVARRFSTREVRALCAAHNAHGLMSFAFGPESCYFERCHAPWLEWLTGWSRGTRLYHRAPSALARSQIVMLLGVGSEQACRNALAQVSGAAQRSWADVFEIAPAQLWAVRSMRRGVSKAHAFKRVARAKGIPREHWAAIGNGFNDLSLFAEVSHAFAMADSPELVRQQASHVVAATSLEGGGVAEAVECLLRGTMPHRTAR